MSTAAPATACPTAATVAAHARAAASAAPWAAHVSGCAACRQIMADAVRTADDPVRRRIADWLTDTAVTHLTPHLARELAAGSTAGLTLGPYLLTDLIGRGGMGAVYRAWHSLLRRTDAVKVMSPTSLPATAVARFLREVAATAQFEHPNVVTVYAADRHADQLYLAMELVRGEDLSHRVKRVGPLPVAEAMDTIRQAARGLGYAHGLGMVHRDIKPGNLLREEGGRVLVADFGLVRWGGCVPGTAAETSAGAVLGTPAYMAPEQIEDSSRADIRADLYGLGATAFHLLTGRPPFTAASMFDVIHAHRTQPAPDVRTVRPDVPAPVATVVATVVAKLLAKLPADRYQTPSELERALDDLSRETVKPRPARPLPLDDNDDDDDATRDLILAEQQTVRTRRPVRSARHPRRWPWIAGAVAALAVVGIVAALLLNRPAKPPTGSEKSPDRVAVPDVIPPPDNPSPPSNTDTGGKGKWVRTAADFRHTFEKGKKIATVGYRSDGKVVAGTAGGEWAVWATDGGNPTKSGKLPDQRNGNTPEYFLPTSDHFLSGELNRWTTEGAPADKMPITPANLSGTKASYLGCGALSADGRCFVGGVTLSSGSGVLLWEPTKGAPVGWEVRPSSVQAVAVTPDGRTVAAAMREADGTIRIWNRAQKEKSWPVPVGKVTALAITADAKTLYSVRALQSDSHELWRTDTATGDGRKIDTPTGQCHRLTISPDGRWLVAAGYGLRIWRLAPDPTVAETLVPPDGDMVEEVMFDAKSRRLLIGGIHERDRSFVREFELRAE